MPNTNAHMRGLYQMNVMLGKLLCGHIPNGDGWTKEDQEAWNALDKQVQKRLLDLLEQRQIG